jgi:hypothetical protein
MPRSAEVLPPSLPPRGLNRVQAAAYIGGGDRKFDNLVPDGRLPGQICKHGRVLWDRYALDAAFGALPDDVDREKDWTFAV